MTLTKLGRIFIHFSIWKACIIKQETRFYGYGNVNKSKGTDAEDIRITKA